MRQWSLHPAQDGTWSVQRGHRPVQDQLSELAARQLVGKNLAPGDKVHQAEQDGYLTDVTKQFVVPQGGRHDSCPE